MAAVPSLNTGATAGWRARLTLGFARRAARTVLVRREHEGPLRVQKALYPEGDAVCHALLLHPPSGIVGGDLLAIDLALDSGAHALLTTPGATKWYRSAGDTAHQRVHATLAAGARLEWLPQENILFDGSLATQSLSVELAADACFLGAEVLCLGRRASGERFASGRFGMSTRITRQGRPLWHEWGTLHGGSPFLDSPVGLRGSPVSATLLLAGLDDPLARALVQQLRATVAASPAWAVSALPGVLVARWLGDGTEAARAWVVACWQVLRPAALGRDAAIPRIWHT